MNKENAAFETVFEMGLRQAQEVGRIGQGAEQRMQEVQKRASFMRDIRKSRGNKFRFALR